MKKVKDIYRLAMVTPAMIGLGIVVLCGLFVFAWDNKNNKG